MFYFLSITFCAVVATLFRVLIDFEVKNIIDSIARNPTESIFWCVSAFVCYQVLFHSIYFLYRVINIRYVPHFIKKSIGDIYKRVMQHSLHWFDDNFSGEIANRTLDFENTLLKLIQDCFKGLNSLFFVLWSMGFLFYVNTQCALVVLIFSLLHTPVIFFLLKKQIKFQKKSILARQKSMGTINDNIRNVFTLKVIGSWKADLKKYVAPILHRWTFWEKKSLIFDAYYVDLIDMAMSTLMAGIQIFLMAILYQRGSITAGEFSFIAVMTLSLHHDLDKFLDRLLFDITPAISVMKTSFEMIQSGKFDDSSASETTIHSGHIVFDNFSFSYNLDRPPVLHHMNVTIPAGQKVGLVGPSGAGKTTFIKCLMRYFDGQAGRITIDGHDINTISHDFLRKFISIIPQDISLLHRSIRENLQLTSPDISYTDMIEACKKAGIHDDIMNMPMQYHTITGEGGSMLSGGQRQRIAIARALLKKAPLLILDEATSALDSQVEKVIQDTLEKLFYEKNMTMLVIAHRLSTLLSMDRILVFSEGKIVQDGPHDMLVKQDGLYRKLWNAQYEAMTDGESS